MLRLVAVKCTELLLRYGTIQEESRAVYVYGFELFWSTFISIGSILIWGTIFRCQELVITFLLFFMPIRTVAGGYHAKSYGSCFMLTNGSALFCVLASWQIGLWKTQRLDLLLCVVLLFSLFYIWKNSPVSSKKHQQTSIRIMKNRRYSHIILGIEAFVLFVLHVSFNHIAVYTAISTSCIVAVMMAIVKKGGQ